MVESDDAALYVIFNFLRNLSNSYIYIYITRTKHINKHIRALKCPSQGFPFEMYYGNNLFYISKLKLSFSNGAHVMMSFVNNNDTMIHTGVRESDLTENTMRF